MSPDQPSATPDGATDPLDDAHAPVRPAYDIDPLIPLPASPNPIPPEVERKIVREGRER